MNLVSEHEAVTKETYTDSENPEEKDLCKKLDKLFERAKKARKKYDQNWHYNYDFVIGGKQWPIERPRWRFSEVANISWATVMQEIGIQTDSRPKFEFVPPEYTDEAFVDVLKELNDRNWEKYNWSGVVQDALFDAKIYHVAHTLVDWDDEADGGLGDVCLESLDPFYCYWDPRAHAINQGKRKARHFIYAEPVPTSQLRKKYPDLEDKIKSDVSDLSWKTGEDSAASSKIFTDFDPYTPRRLPNAVDREGSMYGGEEMTLLQRFWLRDDTLEEVCLETEEKDENGEAKKEYQLKKKYPNGRYIEKACNTILCDKPNGAHVDNEWKPFQFDLFPIARAVNYKYPREYAGENEVTHMKGPQKIVNWAWSYILDMFRMQSNPQTVVDRNADIDIDALTNESGAIVETNNMAGIRREPGTPIASGAFNVLETSQGLMNSIQGLQDVSRGAQDAAVTSGIMLDGYVEAAQTRPRLKNRNLDLYLQDLGQIVVMFYMQFYRTSRIRRYTNAQGIPEFIEFYAREDGIFKVRRFQSVDGKETDIFNEEVEVKGMPDVRITSGSALPYAKAQKAQTALSYLNAGAIDREELLNAVDWPNKENVLKRMAEADARKAEAQAAAQGQKL